MKAFLFNSIFPILKEIKRIIYIIKLRLFKPNLKLGTRCYIDSNCDFSFQSMIGDYCRIFNTSIGDYSYIGPFSICINSSIGKYCSIGPGVKIGLGIHPLDNVSSSPFFYDNTLFRSYAKRKYYEHFSKLEIGNDVWIGANVIIAGGIKIGHGAVIGAGSFVNKDVKPYSIVVGTPAKHLKFRFEQNEIADLLNIKWWDWSKKEIKKNADLFLDTSKFLKYFNK